MLRRETTCRWEDETVVKLFRLRPKPTGNRVLVKQPKTSREIVGRVTEALYQTIVAQQANRPVRLVDRNRKVLWMYRDEMYWADDNLTAADVQTLALERVAKQQRRVQRAASYLATTAAVPQGTRREPIPDDVKQFVWQRDHGVCVRCGGRERLEFDHIIPITMGGSNTARNLQLLCELCNRSKGGNL